MNGEQVLREVKRDPTLIHRLGVGLGDVLGDQREVSFQLPAEPHEHFNGVRPYHSVYLRRSKPIERELDAGEAWSWYCIFNGMANGYWGDRAALGVYVQGGEQLALELA